jgi:hypothetical protein
MAACPRPDPTPRLLGWSVVYVLNLIIPGFFGSIVCRDGGNLGMVLGVVAFYVAVTWAVMRWPRFARWATLGGTAVALTQFAPLIQFWSGSLALWLWGGLIGATRLKLGDGVIAEVGGFVVTVLTGQPLFMVAILLGAGLDTVARSWSRSTPEAVESDEAA